MRKLCWDWQLWLSTLGQQTRSYWPQIRPQVHEITANDLPTLNTVKGCVIEKIAVHTVSGRLESCGIDQNTGNLHMSYS